MYGLQRANKAEKEMRVTCIIVVFAGDASAGSLRETMDVTFMTDTGIVTVQR